MHVRFQSPFVSDGVIINSCSVSPVSVERHINKRSLHCQMLYCHTPNEMKPKEAHYKFDSKKTSDTTAITHIFLK